MSFFLFFVSCLLFRPRHLPHSLLRLFNMSDINIGGSFNFFNKGLFRQWGFVQVVTVITSFL